jgi:acetophenone carboxylase
VFAVVYDPETLIVEEAATDELRRAHRERRLKHARPYAEFVADWEQRLPPEQVLKYFGEWPSGAPNRAVVRI